MKQFIKGGAKLLYNYAMAVIVFLVFLYPFMGITNERFYTWLPLYCILIFMFMFLLMYGDAKEMAVKEKRPQNQMNPYPFKGLLYGLFTIIPIALVTGTAALIPLADPAADRIRHVAINAILGPVYFLAKWLDESLPGYAAAILLIPLTAMLGYLAGYFGINIMKKIFRKKEAVQEKGFTKSPWNPTAGEKAVKKKKKGKTASGGK